MIDRLFVNIILLNEERDWIAFDKAWWLRRQVGFQSSEGLVNTTPPGSTEAKPPLP